MKLSLGHLRQIIRETSKISASPEYMKKEKVRERLQSIIVSNVAAGKVVDQTTLEKFVASLMTKANSSEQLALTALKMIPFEVWLKMADRLPSANRN